MTVPSDSTQRVPELILPSGTTPSRQSSSSRLRSSASHARPALRTHRMTASLETADEPVHAATSAACW